ncbi:MAG: hypothetical protein KAS12_01290 [Candidatus Aenigmarchaeota archaeon]|nr:hypothetical protein [Candidatus Aenigmarchaeota archaeon]
MTIYFSNEKWSALIEEIQKEFPDFRPVISTMTYIKNTEHIPKKDYNVLSQIAERFFDKRTKNIDLFLKNTLMMPGYNEKKAKKSGLEPGNNVVIKREKYLDIYTITIIGCHRSNDEFQWYLSPERIDYVLNVLPSKTRTKYQHIWNTRNITGITQDEANGIALLIDICYQYKDVKDYSANLITFDFTNRHIDINEEPLTNRFYYLMYNNEIKIGQNKKTSFDALKDIFK